jgi:hypothetical protein
MATRKELQTTVNDATEAATTARTGWKDAIPGPDEPKMTDDEQVKVDVLEEGYRVAKAARVAAESALADWDTAETARKAASAAAAPVGAASSAPVEEQGRRTGDRRFW